MKVNSLDVNQLLAFQRVSLEFSPGINVIIGENSTGKTHILKLAYTLIKALSEYETAKQEGTEQTKPFVTDKLRRVFRPDDNQVGRLVNRAVGRKKGSAILKFGASGEFRVTVSTLGKVTRSFQGHPPQAVFIPSREVLAMYPNFTAAYEKRELAFDETYYDICKLLGSAPLRGPRGEQSAALINPILRILGGRVVLKGDRFELQSRRGNLEAPLLSEGFRKLGALAHLIANGSLAKQSVLFWDEPEASLNPKLVTVVASMLRTLAAAGVQVILATHDFLLSQELSLAEEYQTEPRVPMRFFALTRGEDLDISVQMGGNLPDLKDNAILEEFAAHYDREQRLFAAKES